MNEKAWGPVEVAVRWLARRGPLLLVVALALLLHLPLFFAPVGGYHSYNEGFYANRARIQAAQPLLTVILRPADLNNLPLFSWVLTANARLFGTSEWAIRLPSLLAALASVFLIGLLAEELAGPAASVPAALFLTLMPVHLILGTNAQPDMLMLALALGGTLLYVRSYRSAEMTSRVWSGVLFGLATLAKANALLYPAAILLWETGRRRDLGWLGRPSARAWLTGVMGLPLAWIAVESMVRGPAVMDSSARLAGTADLPGLAFIAKTLVEAPWQLGPPISVAALVGAVAVCRQRRGPCLLALSAAVVSLSFYLVYHFHTYYLFPLAPAAAVLAASSLDLIHRSVRREVVLALVFLLTLPGTFSFYNLKIPHTTIQAAAAWIRGKSGERPVVVLPESAKSNSGEQFSYYMPGASLVTTWSADPAQRPRYVVYRLADDTRLPAASVRREYAGYQVPVILGQAIRGRLASLHQFKVLSIDVRPSEYYKLFGIVDQPCYDFGVVDLSRLSPAQIDGFKATWEALDAGATFM
jgi:hypothetical protein